MPGVDGPFPWPSVVIERNRMMIGCRHDEPLHVIDGRVAIGCADRRLSGHRLSRKRNQLEGRGHIHPHRRRQVPYICTGTGRCSSLQVTI